MPRILLIIDEFQELFVEEDSVAQGRRVAARAVRQGRAFGIHVLLGSQTLAGAYSPGAEHLGGRWRCGSRFSAARPTPT